MKKILMGLVALSSIVFAQPAINGAASDGTNVWEGSTGYGSIDVIGTFTAPIKPVRYVIYASADGTWNGTAEDTLTLPTLAVTNTAAGDAIFESTPNSIYVKKVTTAQNNVESVTSDVVFKVVYDPAFTGVPSELSHNATTKVKINFTSLLTQVQVSALTDKLNQANLGLGNLTIDNWGTILAVAQSRQFALPTFINILSTENGVLKFTTEENTNYSNMAITNAKFWEIINAYFASPVSNTFKVEARVK